MQVPKTQFISFRIRGDLLESLKSVENRSEFIRNAIAIVLQTQKTA